MENLEELESEFARIQKVMKEQGEELLSENFNRMMEQSDLVAIKWKQYVPSFNDGDPCEFTMMEPVYKFKVGSLPEKCLEALFGTSDYQEDMDNEEDDQNEEWYHFYSYHFNKKDLSESDAMLKELTLNDNQINLIYNLIKFEKFFYSDLFEQMSETLFGSNSSIVFSDGKFEIEDYDNGY